MIAVANAERVQSRGDLFGGLQIFTPRPRMDTRFARLAQGEAVRIARRGVRAEFPELFAFGSYASVLRVFRRRCLADHGCHLVLQHLIQPAAIVQRHAGWSRSGRQSAVRSRRHAPFPSPWGESCACLSRPIGTAGNAGLDGDVSRAFAKGPHLLWCPCRPPETATARRRDRGASSRLRTWFSGKRADRHGRPADVRRGVRCHPRNGMENSPFFAKKRNCSGTELRIAGVSM